MRATWFLRTPEGRVFLAGVVILVTGLLVVLLLSLQDPSRFPVFMGQTLAHAALGREAAIPFAVVAGFSPLWAALFSIWLGTINLLILLPLLVALRGPIGQRFPRLERWLAAKEAQARTLGARSKAAGILALALASIIPFLPVGAMGSAVVGVALGYPIVPLVLALIATFVVMDLLLAFGMGWLTDLLARMHPAAPWVLVGVILVAMAGAWVLRRRGEAAAARDAPPP